MKGGGFLSKLQAEFTSYMKIALKYDSIDYFRMFSRKNKVHILSLNDDRGEKVPTSLHDVGTFSMYKLN